jgi:hypothetical protein
VRNRPAIGIQQINGEAVEAGKTYTVGGSAAVRGFVQAGASPVTRLRRYTQKAGEDAQLISEYVLPVPLPARARLDNQLVELDLSTVAEGPYTLFLRAIDSAERFSDSPPVAVVVDRTEVPVPVSLAKVSGDEQGATTGATLPNPLVVRVVDASGQPRSGTTVAWSVTQGGGSLAPASAVTDAAGEARATWTLGTTAGEHLAAATVSEQTVSFRATATPPVAAQPTVRIVYLVPSDRTVQPQYTEALRNAIRNLRVWYWSELENGRTFAISDPVVSVHQTAHPVRWYQETPNATPWNEPRWWLVNNMLSDAAALAGARMNDPDNIWLIYLDGVPDCGREQRAGVAVSGVAWFDRDDLQGLAGERVQYSCTDYDTQFPVGRWIGGMGHELGHAFGLPHPRECENGLPGCPSDALMWDGFRRYPATFLLPQEKEALNRHRFLYAQADGLPARIERVSGGGTGKIGTALSDSLVVHVLDASGSPVGGARVDWAVAAGNGSVSTVRTWTDAEGRARVEWTLGQEVGANEVRAAVHGSPPAAFTANGTQTGLPANAPAFTNIKRLSNGQEVADGATVTSRRHPAAGWA